tara:strand:+ start:1284 stop:1586 length:303 start_codon:yes stop_codon:yes gene_type:complete
MEKDIGKIKKNDDTDIVIRIDDFGGRIGLTIREFINKSETGYTGFTKSGTRIPIESFEEFKNLINSINPDDLKTESPQEESPQTKEDSKENPEVDEDNLI